MDRRPIDGPQLTPRPALIASESTRFINFVPGVPVLPEQYVLYKLQVMKLNPPVRYIEKAVLTATSRAFFGSPDKLDERLSERPLGNFEQLLDCLLFVWVGLENYLAWGFF